MKTGRIYCFRLYVTGEAPNSVLACANLRAFCARYLPERHEIEIVDVLEDRARCLADAVYMTPLLVKTSPPPELRIVGSLSDTRPLLQALGIEPA
jgi:circadian clock protein KaiB